jgi:hypothetical protein
MAEGEHAMKKNEIKVGGVYQAKIGSKAVPVRIDGEHVHGGWNATNLETNKKVRIKSAQALREPATLTAGAANPATVAAAPVEAATGTEEAPVAAHAATQRGKRAKMGAEGDAKPDKPLGIVGAAIRILEDHRNQTPLNCSEMVAEMQTKGYWQPGKGGKTPANTLYSAILREINTKAEASRFRKTERGKFLLNNI